MADNQWIRGIVCGLAALLFGPSLAPAAWKPSKPVEFVVMAGEGGGADKMARFITRIIDFNDFSPQPFVPINKPEGSGAEALSYLKDRAGDPHVIMVTLNSFYTTPLQRPDLEIDVATYTPIARMAEDPFMLWVHADSPIKTLEDFLDAARKKGDSWVMAGTGKSSEDHLLTNFLNVAYGLKMKYAPFEGGGRVAQELVGKKADSTVNNPSEQEQYFIDGKTRPLAAFTRERLIIYDDVPTFREKGQDFVYFMQRSIVGPPGMKSDAAAFYRQVFKKVYETKEWQDYMNENSLRRAFLTGKGLREYWLKEREVHRSLLKSVLAPEVGGAVDVLPPPDRQIARGDRLMSLGNVAAARLMYEHAATDGSARAATAAGTTYDPAVLDQLGLSGRADPGQATVWYKKGITRGDRAAAERLSAMHRWLKVNKGVPTPWQGTGGQQ